MNLLRSLLPAACLAGALAAPAALAQINTVQTVDSGVYFHQGDPRRGHCNNGWIVFDDFVLVIDANYPSGAQIVMPKIKETSDKPIRFVLNTHHHPDHTYGNQLWADAGATILASTKALEEMKKLETGYFGGPPGKWEETAKERADVAATKLRPPILLFPDELIFDDGHRRVELHWYGTGHTPGDVYVWMPKEKILFTGDACVNGPQNKVDDGNLGEWIKTLELVKKLGAEKVCPGHGPMGGAEIIADQQAYFVALLAQVKALVDAGKSAAEIKAAAPQVGAELKKNPRIARYVMPTMTAHVQQAYLELGGRPFPK